MSPNGHGGKREGAGRPPLALPRVKVCARVADITNKRMEERRKAKGMCLGRFLDWLLEELK